MAEGFLRALADANGGTYRSVGHGQAELVRHLRPKADVNNFEPRRVFRRPMPPISRVRTSSAHNVGKRIKDDELVLGVSLDQQARAYPINMLTGPNREIINDQLGGHAIAVTWCHLCHSGIAYAREVRDRTLTFAVSGLLWNDNLVMIDTKTNSLWSQLYGKAMRGSMHGAQLQRLASTLTDWKTWQQLHPNTTIVTLSRSTHEYDRHFYRQPEQFVIGVTRDKAARAWPLSELLDGPMVNDEFSGQPLLVTFDPRSKAVFVFDRRVEEQTLSFVQRDGMLIDEQTQSQWDAKSGLALSGPLREKQLSRVPTATSYRDVWEVFYPNSTLYERTW